MSYSPTIRSCRAGTPSYEFKAAGLAIARLAVSLWPIWDPPTAPSCRSGRRFVSGTATISASDSSSSASTSTRVAPEHDHGERLLVTQPDTPSPGEVAGGSNKDSTVVAGEIRIKLFARTDVGQIREHNEDNFLVADVSRKVRGLLESNRACVVGPHGALFAVCDGMGGAAAGEIASQLAVDMLYERMIDAVDDGHPPTRDELARKLVRAIEAAGLRIFQDAKLDRTRRGMGTTVTAAALVDDHLFLAQVGDSRGYLMRQGQLVQLTRDQSLVTQLIEAGQLTEEEAETFEHNNIILQALGTADTVQVDLTYVHLRLGDTLMLCSDGLSGMVRNDEIREVLRSVEDPLEACKTLTDRANQAGGHDNITVVVAKFDGASLVDATRDDVDGLRYQKYQL